MKIACEDGSNCNKDVPLDYQLKMLGLEGETLDDMKGKRVLDLACGVGELVDYLCTQGVRAEGIDPRAPDKNYFTRREVTGTRRGEGFPAVDENYDFIISFQNPILNQGTGKGKLDFLREIGLPVGLPPGFAHAHLESLCKCARCMILEMGRTLVVGGRTLIYPALTELDEREKELLHHSRLELTSKPIAHADALTYIAWEGCPPVYRASIAASKEFGYRTVLTKKLAH